MKKTLVLLVNDRPGLETVTYLKKRGEHIERIYLHSPQHRKLGDEIIKIAGIPAEKIFIDKDLKNEKHVKELQKLAPDFIISVYWKWLLSKGVLSAAKINTVNFHPALLPIGRGWYPHVQSFVNGSPTGVTIHAMDEGMDTGPIWSQKEIPIDSYDTCDTFYMKLQDGLISLFQKIWPSIRSGKIKPKMQNEKKAVTYNKEQTNILDILDLDKPTTARKVLNQLRARSFGNKSFLYFEDKGKKIYVNVRLSSSSDFSTNK